MENQKIEVREIESKAITVVLPIIESEMTNLIYQVDYFNDKGKLINRNIGQSKNKKDNLNRIKRHIFSDKYDKSCQWTLENIKNISKIEAKIIDTVDYYATDKELSDKLTKLEGYHNAKSHANGIATINKFTYKGKEYNTHGLVAIPFTHVELES